MAYKDRRKSGGLDSSPGFMIKAEGAPHRTQLANWSNETQIRIWPQPRPDGSGFAPIRNSASDHDFGEAITAEPCVNRMGVREQFSYITRIPGHVGDDPTTRFCQAIISQVDDKPREVPEEWQTWVPKNSSFSNPANVDKVKTCLFAQGMGVMINGKQLVDATGRPTPIYPILFMGKISVQINFETLANERVDGVTLPPPDQLVDDGTEATRQRLDQLYGQAFSLGDWCSLEHGQILSIRRAPDRPNERPHYEVVPMGELPLTAIAAEVQRQWLPWDQLLRYHTVEEHLQYLCRAFPPEAVDFVFGTDSLANLLPSAVRGTWQQWKSRMAAPAPGYGAGMAGQMMGQPQGYGQPPQQQQPPQQPPQQQPGQLDYAQPQPPAQPAVPPQGFGAPQPQQLPTAPYAPAPHLTQPPQQGVPMQQPPAPQPPMQQPPQPPQQPPAANGYNLGGDVAGQENEPQPGPMAAEGGFGGQPAEFQQPPATQPIPQYQPPQPPQQPQGASPDGTPPNAVAGGTLDPATLASTIDDLTRGRQQAASGQLGDQPQPPNDPNRSGFAGQ